MIGLGVRKILRQIEFFKLKERRDRSRRKMQTETKRYYCVFVKEK
jgi:hypothetical protein